MSIAKGEHRIRTLNDWEIHAGPKSPSQWVDYRSAKEVARAWLSALPELPPEVAALFTTSPAFGGPITWTAEPEAKVHFDELRGEPRNSDLLVRAQDRFGTFVMAVEAKADEPFGETVAGAWKAAEKRFDANPRSRGRERVLALCQSFFAVTPTEDAALGQLRYQLLTATAGALAEAARTGADRSILLVHEFASARTHPRKHQANADALDAFVSRLTRGAVAHGAAGQLVLLPLAIGERQDHGWPKLYLAKVRRALPCTL